MEVEKVVYRERVDTRIEERPDGTKITTITATKENKKDTNTKTKLKSKITVSEKKWSVWAAMGSRLSVRPEPVYTLGIDRNVLLGASVGLYGRTDGEFGVTFRYSF